MTAPVNDTCPICMALHGRHADPDRYPENTVLLQRERFSVIPALGPFSVGHVMVVSNAHFSNLASMGADAHAEYESLASYMRTLPLYAGESILEAEHGSTDLGRGGACIVHTHINWIPRAGKYSHLFGGAYPQVAELRDTSQLEEQTLPYFLVRGDDRLIRVHRADAAPTQMIRRLLFAEAHRNDWDWHVHPNDDVVAETIVRWQSMNLGD